MSDTPPRRPSMDGPTTRQRILDVALDLFIEQGYDKTSIRQIAERMGFTKAAVHYHFPAKADMLLALHGRMHSLMDEPMVSLGEGTVTPERFLAFIDLALDAINANQKLFALHRVNQATLSKLHLEEGHDKKHLDMEERAKQFFADTALSEVERVRMAAVLAATLLTPMMVSNWFPSADEATVTETLKDVARRVVSHSGEKAPSRRRSAASA